MIDSASALAAAVGEIKSPEWALTRQYLAIHRVACDDLGEPVVSRHKVESEVGRSDVYFQLFDSEGEASYHLVVRVTANDLGSPRIDGIWIEPFTRVYLSVWSDSMAPEELASRIGLSPTRSRTKGDPKRLGRAHPVLTQNTWVLEALPGCPGSLDEKVHHLRQELAGKSGAIASLGPAAETILSIVLDDWAGQHSSVSLDVQTARWIGDLGASIDISVYSWGPQMTEEV